MYRFGGHAGKRIHSGLAFSNQTFNGANEPEQLFRFLTTVLLYCMQTVLVKKQYTANDSYFTTVVIIPVLLLMIPALLFMTPTLILPTPALLLTTHTFLAMTRVLITNDDSYFITIITLTLILTTPALLLIMTLLSSLLHEKSCVTGNDSCVYNY